MLLIFLVLFSYFSALQKGVAENVLRLHIVGNSNEPYDQLVKLSVRDEILKSYGPSFNACNNLSQAITVANNNKEDVTKVAVSVLKEYGLYYPVSASVEVCDFPSKTYGSVRLPKGKYTALNIRLGSGSGQNWWCVMYPPMCVTKGTVIADKSATDKLRASLTDSEYALITDSTDVDLKLKFKIVEILKKYKKVLFGDNSSR